MSFKTCPLVGLATIFTIITGFSQSKTIVGESTDTARHSTYAPGLKRLYDEFNVDGMFVLYSRKNKNFIFYNPTYYKQPMSPASTFNILLTLIGLEEGVVTNEKSLLKPNNTTLEYAFRHNVDSCFINLSLLIGQEKIARWLNKINYGNKSILGEKGRFWINGFLQITPEQQLLFMQKFYYEDLPFSKKSFVIVKNLMDESNNAGLGIKIFGKRGSNKIYKHTGTLYARDKYTGWFAGYVEGLSDTYFFVNYIESPDLNHSKIVNAQKEIVFRIIKKLQLK